MGTKKIKEKLWWTSSRMDGIIFLRYYRNYWEKWVNRCKLKVNGGRPNWNNVFENGINKNKRILKSECFLHNLGKTISYLCWKIDFQNFMIISLLKYDTNLYKTTLPKMLKWVKLKSCFNHPRLQLYFSLLCKKGSL